jgi:chemotaxis protein methyltransferase CheR
MLYRRVIRAALGNIWLAFPQSLRVSLLGRAYGGFVNSLIRRRAKRTQYFGTFFLRNRAELELMRRIVDRRVTDSPLDIAIIACSKGAEVYTILWVLRSARPDLRITVTAVDISQEIINFAQAGVYAHGDESSNETDLAEACVRATDKDQSSSIFERLNDEEMRSIFDFGGDLAKVKPWLKAGITWVCANACEMGISDVLGQFEIVVANRFLCHMNPRDAEKCLRNVARIVRPGGYIFVSGIDLDVRTKVSQDLGWKPIAELIEEIHEGDSSLRDDWPLEYWGLEPLDRNRADWQSRYGSAFRVGAN